MDSETRSGITIATIIVFILFGLIAGGMYGCPKYKVYKQEMDGTANLREAEQDRLIQIEEAKANLEAEKLNAKAEVERAKGAAEAMEIENGTLTPTYNQYLFIRTLEAMSRNGDLPTIIYVPADGMLPVMDVNKYYE